MKLMEIILVFGALGTVSQGLEKGVEELEIIRRIQKTYNNNNSTKQHDRDKLR